MNYSVNYDDERFKNVENEKQAALNEAQNVYNQMQQNSDNAFVNVNQTLDNAQNMQADALNQQTNLAVERIENDKTNAQKDYEKEQRASYVDWQKDINNYGATAEAAAQVGLDNTGFSETSKINAWNAYQSRISTARDSLQRTMAEYDLGIKDAQVQNSSALAQLYADTAKQKLQFTLEQFQYNNNLLSDLLKNKQSINSEYNNRWQNVLSQINKENSLAEEARQFNQKMAYQRERDKVSDAQWEKTYKLNKYKAGQSGSGGYSLSDGASSSNSSSTSLQNGGNSTKVTSTFTPNLSTKNYDWYMKNFSNNMTLSKLQQTIAKGISSKQINESDVSEIYRSYGLKTSK